MAWRSFPNNGYWPELDFDMKKLKPLLLVLLIFVAGFAAGVVTTRVAVRRFVQRAIAQPELMREKIQQDLTRKLQLDAGQQDKVKKILATAHARIQAARQEVQPQFIGAVRDAAGEINAVLTPEQRERFAQYRAANARFFAPQ
jgi:cell division protein FtsL